MDFYLFTTSKPRAALGKVATAPSANQPMHDSPPPPAGPQPNSPPVSPPPPLAASLAIGIVCSCSSSFAISMGQQHGSGWYSVVEIPLAVTTTFLGWNFWSVTYPHVPQLKQVPGAAPPRPHDLPSARPTAPQPHCFGPLRCCVGMVESSGGTGSLGVACKFQQGTLPCATRWPRVAFRGW